MTINICFYYTRRRIIKYLFVLYKKTYNKNIYYHYTRRRIMKYLFLLYKTMYNDNKYFIIQGDV